MRHYRRWTAGPDGVAHLHMPAHRTACGVPPTAEKWAWPERSRCPACLAAVALAEHRRPEVIP
jgi:hypothetical protein